MSSAIVPSSQPASCNVSPCPLTPGPVPGPPGHKLSGYFVSWLAGRLLLWHGLTLMHLTLLSSELFPWAAVGGENPRAGRWEGDISKQDHRGDQPLGSSFTWRCWGAPPMPPSLHPTNPSCPKGSIFGSSRPLWSLGIQPPACPMGAGLWGACGGGPLAMLGVSPAPRLPAQGDGAMAEREGVSPPGASLYRACSKPFPCTQHIRGAGAEEYGGTWCTSAHPVQPLQPLLGLAPWGGRGVPGIVPLPLIRRQSRCLSGLFFIRERLLLGHPGPRHWSGRGFAANPGGCAGGSHTHTHAHAHMHTHSPPAAEVLSGCQMCLFISTSHLFASSGQAGY